MRLLKNKRFIVVLILSLVLSLFSGCHASVPSSDGRLQIVATIFPIYDWSRQIAGDQADVTLLLDNGVDLHSYQPTAADIVKISTCDVFIYVGGESDQWASDALKEATNKDMVVLNLMKLLGDAVKEEELVEGMEPEEEAEDEEAEEPEYDEHVWLSLKNAERVCSFLAETLAGLDSAHEQLYSDHLNQYLEKLAQLDADYRAAVDQASHKTLLFGDRFPFRYLTDDYGLNYYAAFIGCSAETEASFETIVFLAGKVDELGLNTILQIETSDGSIARTIRNNTKSKDQTILILDSLQAITSQDIRNGASYLSRMEQNLEILKQALQ